LIHRDNAGSLTTLERGVARRRRKRRVRDYWRGRIDFCTIWR
jgi:hypothetical protein